ncbi:MAG TPA: hypothetical protein VJU16_05330 [Planctomycetota bacterium]|nr:hypothetical protein [Planctomycetota bacterium]
MTPQEFKPISRERLDAYAAREAASPEVGSFEGGGPPNALWIGVAILCILVIGFYTLFIEPGTIKPGS